MSAVAIFVVEEAELGVSFSINLRMVSIIAPRPGSIFEKGRF